MKKLVELFGVILGLFVLIGCAQEQDPVVFESVTVSGLIWVEVEHLSTFHSDVFTEQGAIVDGTSLSGEELIELLEDLGIERPVSPRHDFSFSIELVAHEFEHERSDEDEAFSLPMPTDTIATSESRVATFPDITFDAAGTFTYRIVQYVEADERDALLESGWTLSDAYVYVIVTISEDEENEALTAEVEMESEGVFVNVYERDLSEEVHAAILEQWEERVAQAYEEGYEYVQNADGEYERREIERPDEDEADEEESESDVNSEQAPDAPQESVPVEPTPDVPQEPAPEVSQAPDPVVPEVPQEPEPVVPVEPEPPTFDWQSVSNADILAVIQNHASSLGMVWDPGLPNTNTGTSRVTTFASKDALFGCWVTDVTNGCAENASLDLGWQNVINRLDSISYGGSANFHYYNIHFVPAGNGNYFIMIAHTNSERCMAILC